MPKYVNNYANPVYYNNVTFIPNQEVETYDTLENRASVVGTVAQNYAIVGAANDTLYIRFNDEIAWTVVSLTAGAARTAAQIVADINAAYGSVVASAEGGKVRLDAPIVSNVLNSVYIGALSAQSIAACATLGLPSDSSNPVVCVSLQAFVISQNIQTYNITVNNNTFIFKVNNWPYWITATLTTGAARTAAQIAYDINYAYETATADANKIAFAVEPITGSGEIYVKLIAPVYNNIQSKLYIKTTGNTALAILGFTGDNFSPIAESSFPTLVKTAELPLYNPIISETIVTFAGAGTQYYYVVGPETVKELQFIRIGGGAGITFTCYLENLVNTPPFTLLANESFIINLQDYRISRVVIVANMAGNLTIRELEG
jgi:hypothetical protein